MFFESKLKVKDFNIKTSTYISCNTLFMELTLDNTACCSLLGEAAKVVSDTSVLRRLLFAASTLHQDIPEYWNVVTKFATKKSTLCTDLRPEQTRLIADNIMFTDPEVIATDLELYKELVICHLKEKSIWVLT